MSSMCLKPQCIFYLRWTWADRSLAWFPPRTCWDCCIGWWPGPTAELRGDTSNELLSKAECYQLLVLIVDIMCYIKWRWSSGDMWRVCRCTVHMSHLMSHIWYQPLCHYVSILNDCMMTILVNVKFSFFQSFFFWHCLCNGKAPASKTSRVYNCFLDPTGSLAFTLWVSNHFDLNTWILEYLNTWILEYLNTWILEYLNTWILEYLNTWILEYLNT